MGMQERSLAPVGPNPSSGLTMVVDFTFLKQRMAQLQQFVQEYMVPGEDFGVIEGTGSKPTLLKPGAEKLCDVYGLSAGEAQIEFTRDDTKNPVYISYRISLPLISRMDGKIIMVGVGSANSWEKKYRWRWVFENELPAGMTKEGLKTKQVGKQKQYTQYRIANDEIDDIDNTLLKMAKKRALIDAVLSATRSSALFTQDVEDLGGMMVRQNDTTERDERRQQQPPQTQSQPPRNNGKITARQKEAILASGKRKGLEGASLDGFISGETGKDSLDALSTQEASKVITALNAYQQETAATSERGAIDDDPFASDEPLEFDESELPF